MSAHTPGPWRINDQRKSGWMDNGVYISSPANIARIYKLEGGDKQLFSNARLIAAAPEMLELLKAMRTNEAILHIGARYAEIDEILKKIEGESPHDPEKPRDKNE